MKNIDQEIWEKRKKLAEMKEQVNELRAAQIKNSQILKNTVTIPEAYEMYLNGEATFDEYQKYAENRRNLEHMVKVSEDCFQPDPVVERLEAELSEMEKIYMKRSKIFLIVITLIGIAVLSIVLYK